MLRNKILNYNRLIIMQKIKIFNKINNLIFRKISVIYNQTKFQN